MTDNISKVAIAHLVLGIYLLCVCVSVRVCVMQVDSSLSFLDGFVSDALAQGAAPYKPRHQRQEELSQEKGTTGAAVGVCLLGDTEL